MGEQWGEDLDNSVSSGNFFFGAPLGSVASENLGSSGVFTQFAFLVLRALGVSSVWKVRRIKTFRKLLSYSPLSCICQASLGEAEPPTFSS